MKNLYAGLDVAGRTTAICIISSDGAVAYETETETSATAIAEALKSFERKLAAVGLESGAYADRLHKDLSLLKYPMRCLDARWAHASLRARINKTDANDALGIAQLLARGIYTLSHVKSDESGRIRAVLKLRDAVVIRAAALQRTAREVRPALGPSKPSRRKPKGPPSDGEHAMIGAATVVTRCADAMAAERAELDSIVAKLAKGHNICKKLMKIPGVGPITALNFVAIIDDPTRFKSSRMVAAYFGLTPRTYQSGLSSRSGRISRMGDRSTRKALYAAGRTLLVRCRTDCALRRWGLRLADKKGYRVAYTAVARKLAVLMHHLWITGQDFDPLR